jgi:hypothetical protein
MDHGIEVLQELKALCDALAVAAGVFEAEHRVTVGGEVLGLCKVRIPVSARAVGEDHHGEGAWSFGNVHLHGNLAAAGGVFLFCAGCEQAGAVAGCGWSRLAGGVGEVWELEGFDWERAASGEVSGEERGQRGEEESGVSADARGVAVARRARAVRNAQMERSSWREAFAMAFPFVSRNAGR